MITKQTQNQTSIAATLSHVTDHLLAGSHEFKGGVQYSNGTNLSNGALAGGVSYSDFNGAPDQATFRETSATIGRVVTTGLFAQDNWTIVPRVTLNLGIRFDHSTGDIPETDKLDPTFDNVIGTYPGVSDVIGYNNWSPRAGTAIKLDDAGKTVVKTSYGRYFARLNTGLFTSIAPGGAVSTTYRYNPATKQYDIPLSTTNPKLTATIDPNLKNEYVDQFYVGIERELMPDLGVNASYIYKREKDFIRGLDYRQRLRAARHRRHVRRRHANADGLQPHEPGGERADRTDQSRRLPAEVRHASWCRRTSACRAAGSCRGRISGKCRRATARRRCRRRRSGPGTFGADPNQLVNAYGRFPTDSTHSFRASSTIELPWELQFAIREVYESGRPYGRTITVRGLSQGNATVIAQPRGDFELPSRNDLGIRIGKDLKFSAGQMLRLSLDIQNLFNNDTPLSVAINSSQATYGETTSISLPRRALVGIRYSF